LQEGIGLTIISALLDHIKSENIRACICKQTDTVLVLQFNKTDYNGYIRVYDFLHAYEVEFQEVQDKSICRINLFIGDERICTVTMDDGGIQAFVIDEVTGMMVRPDHYGAISPPELVLPTAEYLLTYREASSEFYKMGIRGVTPDPDDELLWKSGLLKTLDKQRVDPANKTYTYWMVHDDTYIGSIRIRERITSALWSSNRGNFHFEVRPSRWKRGYGKLLVSLAAGRAVQNGVDLLVSDLQVSDMNFKSATKIMEKVGGILTTKSPYFTKWILPAMMMSEVETDYTRFM
jgi:GNAT superfamily N-acetyltransferase